MSRDRERTLAEGRASSYISRRLCLTEDRFEAKKLRPADTVGQSSRLPDLPPGREFRRTDAITGEIAFMQAGELGFDAGSRNIQGYAQEFLVTRNEGCA